MEEKQLGLDRILPWFAVTGVLLLLLVVLVFTRDSQAAWRGEQVLSVREEGFAGSVPWREGLYIANCAGCHGLRGEGLAALEGLDEEKSNSDGHAGEEAGEKMMTGEQMLPRASGDDDHAENEAEDDHDEDAEDDHDADAEDEDGHGHGNEGKPAVIPAPAIGTDGFLTLATDKYIAETIARGRGQMPAFGKENGGTLTPELINGIVEFLRSKQTQPSIEVPTGEITGSLLNGARLYNASKSCAGCHGKNREGVDAPSLNSKTFLDNASDGFIYETIRRGRQDTEMRAWSEEFGGKRTDEEIKDIVYYLRNASSFALVQREIELQALAPAAKPEVPIVMEMEPEPEHIDDHSH